MDGSENFESNASSQCRELDQFSIRGIRRTMTINMDETRIFLMEAPGNWRSDLDGMENN